MPVLEWVIGAWDQRHFLLKDPKAEKLSIHIHMEAGAGVI